MSLHAASPIGSASAAVLVAVSLFGWGALARRAFPAWQRSARGLRAWTSAMMLGVLALYALATVLLLVGALTRMTAIAVLATGLVAAGVALRPMLRRRVPRPGRLTMLVLAAGLLPSFAAAFLATLPPPSWFDAIEYHLVISEAYARAGRLIELPDNVFASFPHALEIVDALVMAAMPGVRVAPLHLVLALVAAGATWCLGSRLHRAGGALAVAALFGIQEASLSAWVEGVDLLLVACVAVSVDLWLDARREPRLAVPAALVAGLGAAIKLQGLAWAAIACAWGLARTIHEADASDGCSRPMASLDSVGSPRRRSNYGSGFLGRPPSPRTRSPRRNEDRPAGHRTDRIHRAGRIAGSALRHLHELSGRALTWHATERARRVVLVGVAALLPVLPFAVINVARHGNPFHPLLGEIFGQTPEEAAWMRWFTWYARHVASVGDGRPLEALRILVLQPFQGKGGTPLFLALAAIPLLPRLRRRAGALAVVAALLFVAWIVLAPNARYGLPQAAILGALAGAATAAVLGRLHGLARRGTLVALLAGLLAVSCRNAVVTLQSRDPVPWLLGRESDADYARRAVKDGPLPLFMEAGAVLPEGAVILSLDEPRVAGAPRAIVAATAFDRRVLSRFAPEGPGIGAAALHRRLRAAGITHVLANPAWLRRALPAMRSPYVPSAQDEQLIGDLLHAHARLLLRVDSAELHELSP